MILYRECRDSVLNDIKPINFRIVRVFNRYHFNFYQNSIYIVAYLLSKIFEKYYCVMKNYGDWKILQGNILSARYKSHTFRKRNGNYCHCNFSCDQTPRQRGIRSAVRSASPLKCNGVRIRLRIVRHVVGDKMLEIPDSLNEHDKQAALDASSGFAPQRRTGSDCLAIANTVLKYERYRSRELWNGGIATSVIDSGS